mmetsp:Transcript_108153/g.345412  ORF Transcript_108153/g.345412 Transcript_108153/m.345412 type:complete len:200 (-) Transcript_108153:416-1015(-)
MQDIHVVDAGRHPLGHEARTTQVVGLELGRRPPPLRRGTPVEGRRAGSGGRTVVVWVAGRPPSPRRRPEVHHGRIGSRMSGWRPPAGRRRSAHPAVRRGRRPSHVRRHVRRGAMRGATPMRRRATPGRAWWLASVPAAFALPPLPLLPLAPAPSPPRAASPPAAALGIGVASLGRGRCRQDAGRLGGLLLTRGRGGPSS